MKIELTISTHTLGDVNTNDDNQRFADAVKAALVEDYPNADISVELVSDVTSDSCWVSDDFSGDIGDNVRSIEQRIWDNEKY